MNDLTEAKTFFNLAITQKPSLEAAAWARNCIKAINLTKKKELIKDWWFIGPFENAENKGFNFVYQPEKTINITGNYFGKDEKKIKWKRYYNHSASGYVDLKAIMPITDNAAAYALTYIYSPIEQKIQFLLGSDDSIKLWVNDEILVSLSISRRAVLDENIAYSTLKKGWNKILLKICQNWGGWGFYFRATDLSQSPIHNIVFDPTKNITYANKILFKYNLKRVLKVTFTIMILITIFYFVFIIIKMIFQRMEVKKLKEVFISSVSHEMKTPITSIKMFAETLLLGRIKSTEKVNEYLETIINQSDRLTDYINNILDFSRLESGQMLYDFKKAPINKTLLEIIDIFKSHYPNIRVEHIIDSDLKEKSILIDKNSFTRAILNILSNAAKYSNFQPIEVNSYLKNNLLHLMIKDKGIGIDKKDLKKIFKKFYRTKSSVSKEFIGTGLGLAIVKRIIKAHDGIITVESILNEGTLFEIQLNIGD